MTITPTYPGVYVTEIPSGSRTVTGVATAITAFVGRASRGPVDDPVPIGNFSEFERIFGGLWRGSGLGYAVRDFYLNGGGSALVVRVAQNAKTAFLTVGEVEPNPPANATAEAFKLTAAGPGAWANSLVATVSYPNDADAKDIAKGQGSGIKAEDLFNLEVSEGTETDSPRETYLNVTVVEGPRQIDDVLASSNLVRVSGDLPSTRPKDKTYKVADSDKGSEGDAPGKASYVGTGFADQKKGLFALLKADLFNILCLPPPTPQGDLGKDIWAEAASFCRDRRALLIVDPPGALATKEAAAWPASVGLTGQNMRNAAFYFPRMRRADPLRGGATDDFAACGAIAGTMARTDGSRGVWKAPAGTDAGLAGVTGLSIPLTDKENGDLNKVGVNCLRTFREIGTVVWGARTLRGSDILSDDYKYIPVRRLALFLEESLFRGTQWVVFEPNDAPLWGQIRTSLGAFMQDLFQQGAFQGTSPRDAYFVRCDAETTTQYDIDRGIVNIQVGFAPLKPAEFVIISIQQKTAAAGA